MHTTCSLHYTHETNICAPHPTHPTYPTAPYTIHATYLSDTIHNTCVNWVLGTAQGPGTAALKVEEVWRQAAHLKAGDVFFIHPWPGVYMEKPPEVPWE